MKNDFSVYLIYIILVGFSIIGLLIFAILKIKKRGKNKQDEIRCGNISVMFDRNGNITIIPYVKDKYGMGRAVGAPQFLQPNYSKVKLGRLVRHSMKLCEGGVPCSDNELMSRLGFRGWKEFSEGKRNISVHYQEGYGVVFNTTTRNSDGAYRFNYAGFEMVLDSSATDEELGGTLLSLLPRCRLS